MPLAHTATPTGSHGASHRSVLLPSAPPTCPRPQAATEHYGGQLEGLLGELQFAFIAFVFGQSLDGYAQWKALLLLFLGCERAALHTAQPLFVQVRAFEGVQVRQPLFVQVHACKCGSRCINTCTIRCVRLRGCRRVSLRGAGAAGACV